MGENVYIRDLVDFDVTMSTSKGKSILIPDITCHFIIYNFHNGAGPSSSVGIPLTQEEAENRALAHNISMRYEVQEEVRPVIETLAYYDKYRKLLDEIWADKVKLDGMIKHKKERATIKVRGQMLKEKKDPGAFIFAIRLEGLINENTLSEIGSDINNCHT
ncbi:hypothetical protein Tco_1295827 [Tanacetum coccineum]